MKKAGDFFDKFTNIAAKEIGKRTIVSESIRNIIGHEIPIENISFKGQILRIKASNILKSEIYIKKDLIIKSISEKLPNQKITSIE